MKKLFYGIVTVILGAAVPAFGADVSPVLLNNPQQPAKTAAKTAPALSRPASTVSLFTIDYKKHRQQPQTRPSVTPGAGVVQYLPSLPGSGHDYLSDFASHNLDRPLRQKVTADAPGAPGPRGVRP